ncbi:hypothetical protein EHQ52_05395 [Leptospira koniambonensis]|uniref:Uncharacterized protein n=1 Tax=Leptospira koniambonensis TaxID=2484950 RepID=A0A4R9J5N8_9LEPT|nr:hypothetical protein [Leptospira koniambonensis]TGL33967.1 hypothetical protein EHQ52_05395 [Leptospira koniambonensis]
MIESNESMLDIYGDETSIKHPFYFDFTREIKADKTTISSSIRYSYHGSGSDAPIEKSGFLKIGDRIVPLIVGNTNNQMITNTSVSTTTVTTTPNLNTGAANTNVPTNSSGGFVDYSKPPSNTGAANTQTKTSVRTYSSKEQTGMFLFRNEDEQDILQGKPLKIRLYMGSYPLTFQLNEDHIDRLKDFLNAKPEAEN